MEYNYNEFRKIFLEAIKTIEIDISEEKIKKFFDFYVDLIETNKSLNLTAITDMKEVIYKHFVDSLSLVKVISDLSNKKYKIIDIGTGAGFPGIPLAIVFDNIDFVLLDSLNKRLKFIAGICEKLNLKNVSLIHGRAEDYAREIKYRENFDFAISRAVANLSTLSELCVGFVKVDGYFISYKSEKANEEVENAVRAFKLLGIKLEKIESFTMDIDGASRNLLVIKKEKKLDKKYPRKAGVPAKEAL